MYRARVSPAVGTAASSAGPATSSSRSSLSAASALAAIKQRVFPANAGGAHYLKLLVASAFVVLLLLTAMERPSEQPSNNLYASPVTSKPESSVLAAKPRGGRAGKRPTADQEPPHETLDEVVAPGTASKSRDPTERETILREATEKVQGFSGVYPTYELDSDNEAPLTALPAEHEDEEAAEEELSQRIDMVVHNVRQEPPTEELHGIRFLDQKQWDAAPRLTIPFAKFMKQGIWWALKPYEKYYASYPIKRYVPRLDPAVKLTPELFHEHFRRHGMPVIFQVENVRHLGFKARRWTFDELRKAFPYNETQAVTVVAEYRANGIRRDDADIDLGPGLAAISREEKLAKSGVLRNYPRNLHVVPSALAKLDISYPPLLPPADMLKNWQLPTLWLGTTTADTVFHHDCCDNFVFVVAGVKRFTLAPPTDWRTLSPKCVGTAKGLCWANVPDPNAEDMAKKSQSVMEHVNKIVIDVKPGEFLYMPAGWFHHVHNVGPTVMVNFWTKGTQQCGLVKAIRESS